MREDRRRRYDDGFRREALELIKSGAGKDALVRRLAILMYTARNWIRLYRFNGEEAVMGGGGSRRYDWETKVAAARDHVENGLTKTEAMASKEIVAWDVSRSPDSGSRSACPPCSRSACPPARSRSCTRTWDGSTSTNGGGRSSNAPASAGP